MDIEFQIAQKEHLESIVGMLANDKLGSQRENYKVPLPEEYVKAFDKIEKDENQRLFVALENDQVVGTFQLSFLQYLTYRGGVRAQIEAVRVHESYRNKGLGKQLINKAVELAKSEGAHVVQLTTDKQRPEALKFYESLGFKASHEGMKLHLK